MDFSQLLAQAIEAKGWSQNAAGPRLGISGPFVNQMVKGTRRPPLDRLDAWAKTLGLSEDERRTFKMLAGLTHIKDAAVRSIIEDELVTLRREVDELAAKVRKR